MRRQATKGWRGFHFFGENSGTEIALNFESLSC